YQIEAGRLQVRLHAEIRHLPRDPAEQDHAVIPDKATRQSRELRFVHRIPAAQKQRAALQEAALQKHRWTHQNASGVRLEYPCEAGVLAFPSGTNRLPLPSKS